MNLDQTLLEEMRTSTWRAEDAEVLATDPGAALVEIYFRWKAVAVEGRCC